MLDVTLTYHLLKAVPPKARLILVGGRRPAAVDRPRAGVGGRHRIGRGRGRAPDRDLPPGARNSLIITNAHRVRIGESPDPAPGGRRRRFLLLRARRAPEAILGDRQTPGLTTACRAASRSIRCRDIQVLTPMQRGLLGAANLNAELQAELNPHGVGVTRAGRLLRTGDRVMQVRNNYDLDVFNGDVGHVDGDSTSRTTSPASTSTAGRVELRLPGARRAGPGLRLFDPQEPGLGISLCRHPAPHPALHPAAAKPALHRPDPRPAAGDHRRQPQGPRHRRRRGDLGGTGDVAGRAAAGLRGGPNSDGLSGRWGWAMGRAASSSFWGADAYPDGRSGRHLSEQRNDLGG